MKVFYTLTALLLILNLSGQTLSGKWYNADGGTITFAENSKVKINQQGLTNTGTYEYLQSDSVAILRIQWADSPLFDYDIRIFNESRLEFATPDGYLFIYFKNKSDAREYAKKENKDEDSTGTKEKPCPRCLRRGIVRVGERFNNATQRMEPVELTCPLCSGRGTIIQ
ncbi:MAG: hypothetical protein ACK4TA_25475 [Saprospiraceae bacterium]